MMGVMKRGGGPSPARREDHRQGDEQEGEGKGGRASTPVKRRPADGSPPMSNRKRVTDVNTLSQGVNDLMTARLC